MTGAPDAPRGLDLRRIGIDEQRHPDAGRGERPDRHRSMRASWPATSRPPSVVTSSARLGHQAAILRLHLAGDADHLVGHRHLEIHAGLQELAQQRHVAVLDVAPILAQMQGDAVGARLLGEQRGVHGIRVIDPPRLAQRRDMIDVHPERDAASLRS